MSSQTFTLTKEQIELIHRVFGGTKIILDSVKTINTGGYVMNDIYNTECNQIVIVYEYGAMMFKNMESYNANDHSPHFNWDEPLLTNEELIKEFAGLLTEAYDMLINSGIETDLIDRIYKSLFRGT